MVDYAKFAAEANAFGSSDNSLSSGYNDLFGGDLIKNKDFHQDIRNYYSSQGMSFSSTNEMLDKWYTDRRWIDSNFGEAGLDMGKYANSSDADQQRHTRLAAAWQRAPSRGTLFDQVVDYGAATILDPVNVIPYAGVVSKLSRIGQVAKAARAAGKTRAGARSAGVSRGVKEGVVEGAAVGAVFGGGFDALQQSREMQQGITDATEYDVGRIGKSAAIEGGLGGFLGGVIGRFASGKRADDALNWSKNSKLGPYIEGRLAQINRIENDLNVKIADSSLEDQRFDLVNELGLAQQEKADIENYARDVENRQSELDGLAKEMETAQANGDSTGSLMTDFQSKNAELTKMLETREVKPLERLSPEEIRAREKQAKVVTAPPPDTGATPAGNATGTATPADTVPTENLNGQAPAPAAPAAPAPKAPTPDEVRAEMLALEIPTEGDGKAAFAAATKSNAKWVTTLKTAMNGYRKKASEAGIELPTDEEIGRLIAAGKFSRNVDKDGNPTTLSTAGKQELKEFISSRGGDAVKQFVGGRRTPKAAKPADAPAAAAADAPETPAEAVIPTKGETKAAERAANVGTDESNENLMLRLADEEIPDNDGTASNVLLGNPLATDKKGKASNERATLKFIEAISDYAKQAKAKGNTPLTMDDIGKLIKSGRLELKKNGALTNRGIQMAKAMASSRGDGKFVLKARATATQVTDEASRIEAYNKANRTPEQVAADKEVSMAADTIFGDIIEAAVAEGVVDNANKIRNKILAGLKNSMTDEVYGAVVRRLDDWANIRKTIADDATEAEVLNLARERMAEQRQLDLAFYTKQGVYTGAPKTSGGNRVGGTAAKAGAALENDPNAGRVFRTYVNSKGETVTTSKISSLFKSGMDIGDGYSVTEGVQDLNPRTFNAQQAQAEAIRDAGLGIQKATYEIVAQGSERGVVGIGRGNRVTKGMILHGAPIKQKDGTFKLKLFKEKKHAYEALGLRGKTDGYILTKDLPMFENMDEVRAAILKATNDFAGDGKKIGVEAANMIKKVDEGGAPAMITANMRKIAAAEGVTIDAKDTPATVIEKIREKDSLVGGHGDYTKYQVELRKIKARTPADPDPVTINVETGKPKAINTVKADGTRGDKILVVLKRTDDKNNANANARIISETQLADGKGVDALLGQSDADLFFIGYVPREINGVDVRKMRTDREAILSAFEPLDDANKLDGSAVDAYVAPPKPVDLAVEAPRMMINMADFTDDQFDNIFMAVSLARNSASSLAGEGAGLVSLPVNKAEMRKASVTLGELHGYMEILESDPWITNITPKYNEAGMAEITNMPEISIGSRTKALRTMYEVLSNIAPAGFKLPNQSIEASRGQLKKVIKGVDKAQSAEITRLFDEVMGDRTEAPIFVDGSGKGTEVGNGYYTSTAMFMKDGSVSQTGPVNRVSLDVAGNRNPTTAADNQGIGSTYLVMHELGHWAYRNLMSFDMRAEFWAEMSKYYDANGKFDGGGKGATGQTLVDERTPFAELPDGSTAGLSNGRQSPQEMFANQFALFLQKKYDAVYVPQNTSVWKKVTGAIRALWIKMTGQTSRDPNLEPLFDKMLTDKNELARTRFSNPKEASTKLGGVLRARYVQLFEAMGRYKEKMPNNNSDTDDTIGGATYLSEVAHYLNGMGFTKTDRAIAAIKTNEDFRANTGPLTALPAPVRRKMRAVALEINQLLYKEKVNIDGYGADYILSGNAYKEGFEKQMTELVEKDVNPLVDKVLTILNDEYMNVEGGDIPEYRMSDEILDLRKSVHLTPAKMAKVMAGKNMKKVVNARKGSARSSIRKWMSGFGKGNTKPTKAGSSTSEAKANSVNLQQTSTEDLLEMFMDELSVGETTKTNSKGTKKEATGAVSTYGGKIATEIKKRFNKSDETSNIVVDDEMRKLAAKYSSMDKDELTAAFARATSRKDDASKKERDAIRLAFSKQKGGPNYGKKTLPLGAIVNRAVVAEVGQEMGTGTELGIPANAPVSMRSFLGAINHRTGEKQLASRTIAARLARLGVSFPATKATEGWNGFLKEIRNLGTNVSKSDDITQTLQYIGRTLYATEVLTPASRRLLNGYARQTDQDPSALLGKIFADFADDQGTGSDLAKMRETLGGDDIPRLDDLELSLSEDMMSSASYVLDGVVASKAARRRFPVPFVRSAFDGDGASDMLSTSHADVYDSKVPSEFAAQYARTVIDRMNVAQLDAVDAFTGNGAQVMYRSVRNSASNLIGSRIDDAPVDHLHHRIDQLVSGLDEPQASEAAELIDTLSDLRGAMNKGGDIALQREMAKDIEGQLAELGVTDLLDVEPVFVRDRNPVAIVGAVSRNSDGVQKIISALRRDAAEGTARTNVEARVKGIMDTMSATEMYSRLALIAGGKQHLNRILREHGFSSISVGGERVILNSSDVRSIKSNMFTEAEPVLGASETTPSGLNRAVITSAQEGAPYADIVANASRVLEAGGVPPRTLDQMIAAANGRNIGEDGKDIIRKSNVWNPLATNSAIMRKSGIRWLANHFEPEDGSGGHFERTNEGMGKFLMPLTRMLNELPDSKNVFGRYWQNGPTQMAQAAMSTVGFTPNRRASQPASHMNIVSALRNSAKAGTLDPQEKAVYNQIRSYLGSAVGRMREAGMVVGDVGEDYFPQVWRKDMILANRDEFVRRMAAYLKVEQASTGGAPHATGRAEEIAERIVTKLTDEDGVLSQTSAQLKAVGSDDHLDYQRMIRLQDFKRFADFENPDSLAGYLENDVLVAMTKYSDNLEHRLDMTEAFGVGAHGYHDYTAILSSPTAGRATIATLLRSNKILRTNYAINAGSEEGLFKKSFDHNVFMSPFKEEYPALAKADELIAMAKAGASSREIEESIMQSLDAALTGTENAQIMRNNFKKRATAIANALNDTKGLTVLTSAANIKHANGFYNAAVRRPIEGLHGLYAMADASKWLRGINAVTLLTYTTLTSIPDLVLPLVRTGDVKAYTKALTSYMSQREGGKQYREMIRNIGAATENVVHQRMTMAHGVESTQFMSGFFNSTLLTPWTDTMRDIGAAVSYEHLKAQSRIAREYPNSRAGRIAKRILKEEGLEDLYQEGDIDMIMQTRGSEREDPRSKAISSSVIKLTNKMIFTPNPNDIVLWGQTPLGAIVMQLKSFPIMMGRLIGGTFGEAFAGEGAINRTGNFAKAFVGASDNRIAPLAALLTAAPAFGAGAVAVKDIVQGRGGEDNRQHAVRDRRLSNHSGMYQGFKDDEFIDKFFGWGFDGFVAAIGFGFLGDLMYEIASQSDNGAYGQNRVLEAFAGPTLGLANDALTVTQGVNSLIEGDEANGIRRAAVRETTGRFIPFLPNSARESVVDRIAGVKNAGQGGSGGYGGGYGSGY
tara:strand:+ start:6941 stop:17026 length:10086 start_codon:yes stop_codon:yes gene_type:complete